MKCPHNAHVAVVDGEKFLVLRNAGDMDEPKLANASNPDLEETNFSSGTKHRDKSGQRNGSTDLNELAHGAAAANWLNAQALENRVSAVLVIADPTTLGEMRRHYHKELQSRLVGEIAKNLAGEPISVIERAIAAA